MMRLVAVRHVLARAARERTGTACGSAVAAPFATRFLPGRPGPARPAAGGWLRRSLLAAVLVAVAAPSLQAQLTIRLQTDRKHYLRYEPIEVTVVLRNYSGNTLIFSDQEGPNRGSLRFTVQRPDGPELRPKGRALNPVEDLILGAGETRQLVLQLSHFFDLRPEGSYVVSAQIGHQRLPNDYRSEPVSIEVRDGVPLITRNLGLPQADGGAAIAAVTATLMLFHDGERWLYCLRAETESEVLGTVRLGPQIAGVQPQMDADAASDLHVLVQLQSRLCLYAVYGVSDAGLRLRQRRFYQPDQFGPRLTQAPGYLKVVGGVPTTEGGDGSVPELQDEKPGATPAPLPPGGGAAAVVPAAPATPETPPPGGAERPARD